METRAERFKQDCLSDIDFFASNPVAPLFIAPEDGPIAKVELRRVQKRIAHIVNRQWYTKGCLRIILCKARRIGSTTFFCMDAFRQAALKPNTNVVIGAQLDDMAERIHERNHIFYANYPPSLRPERAGRSRSFKEPMDFRRHVTEEELMAWERGGPKPDHGLNSSISIFTERTPLARTGATIQYLLLSEFAKYRNQSTIIKEMFPTVRRGTGAIVIDTTAEGRGDSYSRLWEEAVAGRSEFEPVFVSWLDDDQQCHQVPEAYQVEQFYHWMACVQREDAGGIEKYSNNLNLNEDESLLLRDFIVPRWAKSSMEEQDRLHPMGWICWRRWAIQDRCDGKVQIFRNQYPTHWREAFLSSAITIFDMGQIAAQSDRISTEKPPERGELIEISGRRALDVDQQAMMAQVSHTRMQVNSGMFSFVKESFGPLRIYEHPVAGEEYIISSDYAEGVSDNCDYNTIHVYRRGDKLEQVAHFREKCYPEECASEALALGAYYNMAWQIPEVNSCGAAALALFRTCYPVHRIFRRKVADNARKFSPSDLMGWKMTGRSKAEAVGGATTYWKQGLCIIRNKNTLRELEVFVKKSSRMLPEAMEGTDPITGERYHDDEVTAFVLAIFANRQLPFKGRSVVERESKEKRECAHPVIAGAKCLKCRKEFPEAKEEPLTFEALRKMVKARNSQAGNRRESAIANFWTGGWGAIR
tara:strand:- start:723 stop:2822 length:2100 start_codon:yes stop_codon:yes gene_type:complete